MPQSVLRFDHLSFDAAQILAERIEELAAAIAINVTDEARGIWSVAAYFDPLALENSAEQICAVAEVQGRLAILPDADWVAQSLKGLHPVTAGRFYLHGAHDRHRRRDSGVSLEIDAGTAFGTGHHATTEGCLLALDVLLRAHRPRRILDVGCGTGVLALAAARSLRRPVLASDIDPEAVRVTRLNARRNAAGASIRAVVAAGLDHPAIHAARPFDLIFANILARPLVRLAPSIVAALGTNGHLILAGLTTSQVRWVGAAYRNRGLLVVRRFTLAGWAVLVFGKAKRPP